MRALRPCTRVKRVRPGWGPAPLDLPLSRARRLLSLLHRVPLTVVDVHGPRSRGPSPGDTLVNVNSSMFSLSPHEGPVEKLHRAEIHAVADASRVHVEGLHGGKREVRPSEPRAVQVCRHLLRPRSVHQPPPPVQFRALHPPLVLLRLLRRRGRVYRPHVRPSDPSPPRASSPPDPAPRSDPHSTPSSPISLLGAVPEDPGVIVAERDPAVLEHDGSPLRGVRRRSGRARPSCEGSRSCW